MNSEKTFLNRGSILSIGIIIVYTSLILNSCQSVNREQRKTVLLNGAWKIEESLGDEIPQAFSHTIQVPGFADLAEPKFDSVGFKTTSRNFFWYQKKFKTENENYSSVRLKINKAKYSTKVWLNGKEIGLNMHNFTPSEFDISKEIMRNDAENELVVRLFAHHELLPDTIVWGHDFEMIRYHPGIYDNVELIYSNAPYIRNVQIVPDIEKKDAEVIVWLDGLQGNSTKIQYVLTEAKGQKQITKGENTPHPEEINGGLAVRFKVVIPNCKLWSPESPFLYQLKISTDGDESKTRFGMRKFCFNPKTGFAELNGKTYFMRGTNICFHRFIDDDLRVAQPWDTVWVKKLYQSIKDLNMNSFRFCLGFPPEFWYDMADEMGFLISDEYPIWYGAEPDKFEHLPTSNELVSEYTDWMQERWNHACVVIWDAQNESVVDFTGKAIQKVRQLDFSNRPWDNGYASPMCNTDPIEAHPYVLQNYLGRKPGELGPIYPYLKDRVIPDNGPSELSPPLGGGKYPNPIINNENTFFWIERNGKPTWLTKRIFDNIYGKDLTVEEYRENYAKMLNRIISYWRVNRTSAAVSHFCALGYSRNATIETKHIKNTQRGCTSDAFIDVDKLILEPNFKHEAFCAFYPIGMFINRWEEKQLSGSIIDLPIQFCNDLYEPQDIDFNMSLKIDGNAFKEETLKIHIEALGVAESILNIALPDKEADGVIEVSFVHHGKTISQQYGFKLVKQINGRTAIENTGNEQFIHNEKDKKK